MSDQLPSPPETPPSPGAIPNFDQADQAARQVPPSTLLFTLHSQTEYSNPPIPEGINVSAQHPVRAFFVQGGLAVGIFALCLGLLSLLAGLIAPHLPFSWEQRAAARFFPDEPATPEEQELRRLADRVVQAMGMPPEMPVVIHYQEDEAVNAGATLGGHIVVFRGILRLLESEDELAALLAHEIAHVKHRDVAQGVLRGLATMLLFAGVDAVSPVFSGVSGAVTQSFSRKQESRADSEAVAAVAALYGHTAGASRLFTRLRDKASGGQIESLELTRSHPNFTRRIDAVQTQSQALGRPETGPLTPLSEVLRKAGQDKPEKQ